MESRWPVGDFDVLILTKRVGETLMVGEEIYERVKKEKTEDLK
jgi:sRNA-binding carbon storage regulator CsrA